MAAHPGGRVQGRAQAVAAIKRYAQPLLKVEDRPKPQLAKHEIARGEAVIERACRRLQAGRDRRDRYRGGPLCGGDGLRCIQKVALAEFGLAHRSRILILEWSVKSRIYRQPHPEEPCEARRLEGWATA